jgi:ABC-2 type transport system ATP-binding protein
MMSARTTDLAVRIRGLRVERGGHLVLPGLDLDIRRGMITGLLGPSGCGKSTLMRAIVGVQVIAAGEVTVLGERAGSGTLRKRVGYVTQRPSVYPDLTVRENLEFFRRVLRAPSNAVDRAMEAVSLTRYADQTAAHLSGGQFARVSLAAALLGECDLFVLDEPTVGLDPVLRRDLWALFHRLAAEGATLLVSSHVMDEATRCDELVLMREGRLLVHERPGDLLSRTHTDKVEDAFLALIGDNAGVTS